MYVDGRINSTRKDSELAYTLRLKDAMALAYVDRKPRLMILEFPLNSGVRPALGSCVVVRDEADAYVDEFFINSGDYKCEAGDTRAKYTFHVSWNSVDE